MKANVPILNTSSSGKTYIGFRPNHPPHLKAISIIDNSVTTGNLKTEQDMSIAATTTANNEMRKAPSTTSISLRRLLNAVKISRKLDNKNENNLSNQQLVRICNDDIKKFKSLMNDQVNEKKLKEQKLPSLKRIIEQPKIKAAYIAGNLKIMGENYNPFNFNSEVMRSNVKRNVFGSLYQH